MHTIQAVVMSYFNFVFKLLKNYNLLITYSLCNFHLLCIGAKMLRYRQSSLWFPNSGMRRLRVSSRPRGIRSRAAVSLWMSGSRCGQAGPGVVDRRTPSQGMAARVGAKRFEPIGGVAYGTPRNTSIGFRCRAGFMFLTNPWSLPYRVCTILVRMFPETGICQLNQLNYRTNNLYLILIVCLLFTISAIFSINK